MPATPLRRTLSAPAARATPYPVTLRRSPRQGRRRVLGDIGGHGHRAAAALDEQGRIIPVARAALVTDAPAEPEDVTLFNVPSEDQMALAPQPEYLAYELEGLTLAPAALSLAPQTPSRIHREASPSPIISDTSSAFDSDVHMSPPLFAPDFGLPEPIPRRTRNRRTHGFQRTSSEFSPSPRAVGSRRRYFERVASAESFASRSSFQDENAPIGVLHLFN